MRRFWKKAVALLMSGMLAVQILPAQALAAGREAGEARDGELMEELAELCGSEEDAERYYDMLEEYGFMDSSGNAAESWSITMDGESVTLEEIRDILDDESSDKSKYVVVDGTAVTLADLETMIEIEDYIAYLEETYYSPQEWSEEQLANLDDLVNQINTEGIEILSADDEGDVEWTSVNHDVRLNVEMSVNDGEPQSPDILEVNDGDVITFSVTPSEAQLQDITFTWRITEGSAKAERSWDIVIPGENGADDETITADEARKRIAASDYDDKKDTALLVDGEEMTLEDLAGIIDADEWTVTIPEGSTDPVAFSVATDGIYDGVDADGDEVTGRVDGEATFLVQIYDVTNALFDGTDESGNAVTSTRWEQQVSVESKEEFHYRADETVEFSYDKGDFYYMVQYYYYPAGDFTSGNTDYKDGTILAEWGNTSIRSEVCPNAESILYVDDNEQTLTYLEKGALYNYLAQNYRTLTAYVDIELEEDGSYVGTLARDAIQFTGFNPYDDDEYTRFNFDYKDVITTSAEGTWITNIEYSLGEYGNAHLNNSEKSYIEITNQSSSVTGDLGPYSGYLLLGNTDEENLTISGDISGKDTYTLNFYISDAYYYDTISTALFGGPYPNYVCYPNVDPFNVTVSIWDTTQKATATLSAPAGTYYAGQTIPIVATFDYPMYITDDMYISVNNVRLYPEEAGSLANTCTFLYTVKEADNTSLFLTNGDDGWYLSGTGANGLDVHVDLDTTGAKTDEESEGKYISEDVNIKTPDNAAAITGITATITDPISYPVLNVTVQISDVGELTEWLLDDLQFDQETGIRTSQALSILYNGEEYPLTTDKEEITGATLTASIPIDLDTTDHSVTHLIEILIDGEIYMELYAKASQAHTEFFTEDDITALINVYQEDGMTPYEYTEDDDDYTVWIQDSVVNATFTLEDHEEGWSFGDDTKDTVLTGYGTEDYGIADEDADFVWWIGDAKGTPDNSIANIDAEGNVIPTGSYGTAYVYLTALNGDDKIEHEDGDRHVTARAYRIVADENGDDKTIDSVTFGAGLTPFLYIPYNEVTSVAGQDVTIYWTSNLCDKNGDEYTTFHVTVACDGDELVNEEVTGTAESPASGYTVSGDLLEYDYDDSRKNTFEFTVSSEYEGIAYEDTAVITLQPTPAVVSLGSLSSYYITDDPTSINITWDVENFGYFEGEDSGQFLFLVTTDDGETVGTVTKPGSTSGDGKYSGSYTLSIGDVTADPSVSTSYRKIYTVTVAAKNGGDSTFSYDSFLLYVYDRDALDIWVNGVSESAESLSNVKTISEMSQEEILALNRDIYLKAMVSANYGEYAWTELTDQMAWASSDSRVASVNYQQGTLYENIEHFSYTTYRPTTDFGITGLKDGETTITLTHSLTGISDSITVDVERLDNQLYLFQCYPQTTTYLTYTNGNGEEKTVESASDGSAAIYEESGIASDVYCQSTYEGDTYLGTFYNKNLKSGEGDWTLLERYPCNNLTLRRAAYAYMYIKNPDGTPYTGSVTVRGGIYLNGEYIADGFFDYNGEQDGYATQAGYEDYTLTLGKSGKLEVTMDQSQWGTDTGAVSAWDDVSYVFEIDMGDGATELYPMIVTIDANISEAAYVGNGEAVVTFRENPSTGEHPFVVGQMVYHGGSMESVLDGTGSVGPSATSTSAELYTIVMWWGDDDVSSDASVQLFTQDGDAIATADAKHEITHEDYPFSDKHTTTYSVMLDESTVGGLLDPGESTGLYLEYYKDGTTLSRREDLTFSLTNMIGVEEVTDSNELLNEIQNMGLDMETDGNDASSMGTTDTYVNAALSFVADTDYTGGSGSLFNMQLAPTSDPTKFLGFVEVNVGSLNMDDGDDDDDSQIQYVTSVSEADDWEYWPGQDELMTLAGKKSVTDYFADAKENLADGKKGKAVDDHDLSYSLGGYMETLIYYDYSAGHWKMQVLSGGFNVGGGYEWCWNFNTVVGVVPFTATVKIGAEAKVSMDAITAAYYESDGSSALGNDYLTELRMFLYLYFFAGVGIDYAVVAFKLGVYGEVDLDMSFDWLNRKYLTDGATPTTNTDTSSKLKGQDFAGSGEIGLELVVKLLFIEYEKVLFSYNFDLFDKSTGQWTNLQNVWKSDQNAYDDMISLLLANNSLSVIDVGGGQALALNLAATKEDVSYLSSGSSWGSGISALSLDTADSGLNALSGNSYAFADPIVTEDGSIVAFLGVPSSYGIAGEGGIESENVSAMFALSGGTGSVYAYPSVIPEPTALLEAYPADENLDDETPGEQEPGEVPDEDEEEAEEEELPDLSGYGDSELSLAGSGSFAVAAWTRQMVDIPKDDGAVLTEEDQRMMLDGTDIAVSVYDGGSWSTTLIQNGGADVAPVVATDGSTAIVAWRSVAVSDKTSDLTDFDQKDTILYKIYSGGEWSSETYTLYNGTSGNVKGITAEMLNGTAAVAYALDTDTDTNTYTDREIVYAVIDTTGTDEDGNLTGEVKRNVRATNDAFLDENPQLTTVTIGGQERFLLGWYTEQSGVEGLDGSDDVGADATTSDIRMIDFDTDGNATQLMPDSISAAATAADVSVTSDFAFTKGSGNTDINNLSIIWTERANEIASSDEEDGNVYVEKDVLKAVKFYTYGQGQITFTGAADVAEMPDGTLIDSFDAYTSDGNTIKAVIMGTTYGEDGAVKKQGVTEGGDLVSYEVTSSVTNLYTATEEYGNSISVPNFVPDYETLKLGSLTDVWFEVENDGIDPIDDVVITVGDTATEFSGINLLPGGTLRTYADYRVPYDAVVDEEFTVTAYFTDGTAYTYGAGDHDGEENLIYMNLPDVAVTDAEIIREENGERDILVKLNNTSDAALGESSGTYVKVGFYSDATCESPIKGLSEIVIDGEEDLTMIDEGGYSVMTTFDVGSYLKDYYGKLTEIPETGVQVYVKADVIDAETDEAQGEYNTYNNYDVVTCENLEVRTGQDVTVTSTMDIDGSDVTITVEIQNTRLTETTTGNIIVTILDEYGRILGQKQSYSGTDGLITLGGEEKATVTFTFTDITDAFTVDVAYVDMVIDDDDEIPEGLEILTFPNLGLTIDDFVWDEAQGAYVCSVEGSDDLTWVSLIAVARDAKATITVNGVTTNFYALAENLDINPGKKNVITVEVTNRNGVVTRYILTIEGEEDEEEAAPTGRKWKGKAKSEADDAGGTAEVSGEISDASGDSADASDGTAVGSVKTGDTGRTLIILAMLAAVAVALAIVSGRRRRRIGRR